AGRRVGVFEHASAIDPGEAVAGVELQVAIEAIGGASHQRIGEAPVPSALVAVVHAGELVPQVAPFHLGAADTRADIGRDAVPGAQVDIGVGQQHQRRVGRGVLGNVGEVGGLAAEIRLEPVVDGQVGAEIVVDLV